MTPPEGERSIVYGCEHWPRAAASVRARSCSRWYDARPQRPTTSSGRTLGGTSAAAGGDGGGGEEGNGVLKLLPKFVELQPASVSTPAASRTPDNTGRRKRAIGM